MHTSNEPQALPSQALTAGISMVDSLLTLRSSITNINSSSALINSKPPYEWTADEWYTFFFAPITAQEAIIQVADASAPIVGQYNTQILKAGSAIAATYREIHNQPEGDAIPNQRKLELARSIVEPIILAGITPVALLAATVTRAGATYYPPENIAALSRVTNTQVADWLGTNLRQLGTALNPQRLFATVRDHFNPANAMVDQVTGQRVLNSATTPHSDLSDFGL